MTTNIQGSANPKIAVLIPGHIEDGGFFQQGYEGYKRIVEDIETEVSYLVVREPGQEGIREALLALAQQSPELIIAHGGQCDAAALELGKQFPNIQFVVIQGAVSSENVSSYEVLQEYSAWAAGVFAGLSTKTNVVGHISGIKPLPGQKGRAAFADGVAFSNPQAKLLTTFTGSQEDQELNKRTAAGQIKEGADYIYTMLGEGRKGVTEAVREGNIKQIANAKEFFHVAPDVFIASALADLTIPIYEAAKDWKEGNLAKGIKHINDPKSAYLSLSADVPEEIAQKVRELEAKVWANEIAVKTTYDGPEFPVPVKA